MPLPSNGTLMGSNGLPVWLGNRSECLLVLDDPVSLSGVTDPFTRQCSFVIVTSSWTSVCSSVLSAVVSQNQDLRKIQLQIAEMIGLNLIERQWIASAK